MREVDGAVPILSLKTFAQHLDGSIELWIVRAGAALFSVFGGLALFLATVGVYGVKAYSVARRTREIGIRMALGAQPGTVQRMILREGAVMLASGVPRPPAGGRNSKLISGMLYHVGAFDPLAFTIAPLVLAAAAPRHLAAGQARHAELCSRSESARTPPSSALHEHALLFAPPHCANANGGIVQVFWDEEPEDVSRFLVSDLHRYPRSEQRLLRCDGA